jgi:hypothetical protein
MRAHPGYVTDRVGTAESVRCVKQRSGAAPRLRGGKLCPPTAYC